ncbi:MAG: response regulator [Alphaproteobacteria bacterium]
MSKILIAEDDRSMCQFLKLALERAGHSVITAHDGLEAFSLLEKNPDTDLLLSDIVMPGMDGVELAQTASKKNPSLRIMFITGFSGVAMADGRSPLPSARLLSKPFHLNDLIEQVEKILATPE